LVEIAGGFFKALGKVPGMGWAKSIGKGLDDIAAKAKIASKNLADLKSSFAGMGNVSMTTGTAGVTGGSTTDTPVTTTTTSISNAKKRADEIAKTLKTVASVYSSMNKVIADSEDKVADATKRRDKDTAEARARYRETIADADKALFEASAKAFKRNKEQLDSISKDYAKRTLELETKLQDAMTDLRKKAAEKSTDLVKRAAEKQETLVQQSIDRLRNAFASKTQFSLVEAFGSGASGETILGTLKSQMSEAKNLAEKAAFLQANGFSQTFIEQVMSAGPKVGNELADAILNSTPETIRELQKTFSEMESVSNNGLDALAKSMNTGGKLATKELTDAYAQVAIDLQTSLVEVQTELTEALDEANQNFNKAMTEANALRDEGLAEAAKDLQEALAEANQDYQDAVAEAEKTLADTLEEIQVSYKESIDQIAKDTQEKIDELQAKLKELAATLAALGATSAAAGVLANAPKYNNPAPINSGSVADWRRGEENSMATFAITQNISYPTASASEISAQTLNAIKFGTTNVPVLSQRGARVDK
jgi:F0F1-type ATP synthase membrane subunit b/b'